MKLEPTKPKKNRPLETGKGCLVSFLGLALFWAGLNSYLIGRAYHLERGAWAPRTVGVIGALIGLFMLWRGMSRFVKYAFKPRRGFEDEF